MSIEKHLEGLFVRGSETSIIEYCIKNGIDPVYVHNFLLDYGEFLIRGSSGVACDFATSAQFGEVTNPMKALLLGNQCFGEFLKQFEEQYEIFEKNPDIIKPERIRNEEETIKKI